MNAKALNTLEYDKIIKKLSEKAVCCIAKELAAELKPNNRLDLVQNALALTGEAESALFRTGQSPVDAFPDMRECLKRIHVALYLSALELMNISRCLRAIRSVRDQLTRDEAGPMLKRMAEGLAGRRSIEDEINRCIINEDEIFDGASPALARIRRSIRLANERIRDRLNSMIRSSSYAKFLQEPLVTIRNGRYVIPVKQEYRQNVPGLIHDQSGSGATLFIEPSFVVETGNELKKLLSEEAEEIERILAGLTALVEPYADEILEDLAQLGELDLIFAKAALSREYRGVCPKLNEKGRIRIVRGRHPLISPETVVPIDIWLGGGFSTLIITGPNTGGKTVTLKTVGLFSIMAQAGMFVPADEGTELSLFEAVYADIGDEQSIEQSLSTFSSHMKNIVSILEQAGHGSLVLLDELGAGTDPVEGAALAMSILKELHDRRAITVATTHYSEIKAFALTNEGMENASMEFDIDRLCPTFRLFIGIPGKSNAFEISRRLGLSDGIIENARGYLENDDIRFEDVISNAESQRRIAEQERALAQQARAELDRLRNEAEAERRKLAEEKSRSMQKAKDEARRLVTEAKQEAERIIAKLRAAGTGDRSAIDREIQSARDLIREEEKKLADTCERALAPDDSKPPKTVNPGDSVIILSLNQRASVLSRPDARGEVQVQAGIIKLNVKLRDIRAVKEEAGFGEKKNKVLDLTTKRVGMEIDVRGMLVDEAAIIIDRYLDDAAASGLSEVNIIHGKGTGALRTGVQEFLRQHPLVKSFRIGAYGEGDAGVTVVKLK